METSSSLLVYMEARGKLAGGFWGFNGAGDGLCDLCTWHRAN